LRPQVSAEFEAVFLRQHQIQNDQLDRVAVERLAHRASVLHRRDAELILLQILDQQLAEFAVVVNDQDVISGVDLGCDCRAGRRLRPGKFCIIVYRRVRPTHKTGNLRRYDISGILRTD
jgi:hypothetical protein